MTRDTKWKAYITVWREETENIVFKSRLQNFLLYKMKLANQNIIELVILIFKDIIQIHQVQQVNLENSANILKFKIIKLLRLMITNQFIVFSKNLFIEMLKVNQFISRKILVKLKFAQNHVIIVRRKKRKLNKMIKINFEFSIKSFSTFSRCFFFFRFWSNT